MILLRKKGTSGDTLKQIAWQSNSFIQICMTLNRGHLASLCNWSTGKNPEYLLKQCMKRSFFYLLKIIANSELLLSAERGRKNSIIPWKWLI